MQRAVTKNGRGEFLTAVSRVIPGKGQAALADILFHIVDVIKGKQACEKVPHPLMDGSIDIGEQHGGTARCNALGACHNGIKAFDGIAVFFAVIQILLDVRLCSLGILFRSPADGGDGGLEFLIHFALCNKLVQVIVIGDKVKIAVFLPGSIHVADLLVVGQLCILFIFREDERIIHRIEQKNHDDGDRDHHGYTAAAYAFEKIL